MFHYKNYHHQPALVRLSTMTGCLFYLAGLSEDPHTRSDPPYLTPSPTLSLTDTSAAHDR